MERSFWKVLMMVGAVATAITLAPRQKPLTYKEAVMLAVDLYNEKAAENFTFRLINAIPQPEWDANSESTQELNFTIKETGCPAQEERPEEESSFRCDGLVKACSGYYFLEEFPPVTIVSCDEVEVEPKRVKRSKFKKFLKKAKDRLRRIFKRKKKEEPTTSSR